MDSCSFAICCVFSLWVSNMICTDNYNKNTLAELILSVVLLLHKLSCSVGPVWFICRPVWMFLIYLWPLPFGYMLRERRTWRVYFDKLHGAFSFQSFCKQCLVCFIGQTHFLFTLVVFIFIPSYVLHISWHKALALRVILYIECTYQIIYLYS